MRKPLVAGNWKMNATGEEAVALAAAICRASVSPDVEVCLCPPFVWLERVQRAIEGSQISLGAQNCYYEDWGAFTGEVSPLQIAEICQYVILGHSERRHIIGESDEVIARKVQAAWRAGLVPILAVGEVLAENEAGQTEAVIDRQLRSALTGWNGQSLVVAYEPVWAIGSGRPATPEHAESVAVFIRGVLSSLGQDTSEVRVLYGGSVTAETFPGFAAQPNIDGALVGGASLKSEQFTAIVNQAAEGAALRQR